MDRFTVAFFGHKHIDVTSKIEKALDENVQRILAQKEHVNFLFGRDSDFDLLAASSVRRVRKQYREDNSSLTLIIPEITPEYLEGVDTPENYYSEIEVCLAAAVALPKYMMQVRNHEMIDRADLVLCYVMGTHFIVACAASLLTCISLWFKKDAGDMGDGARIAAQIVSGVGFLGAGMIFFRRESMRGLTTAAGIWATAAIGMCAATGMFLLATGSTVLIILLQIMNHTKLTKKGSVHLLLVKLEYNDAIKEKMREFFGFHNFHRFKITSNTEKVSASVGEGAAVSKLVFVEAVIRPTDHCSVEAIAQFICENPEIKSIERLEDL